MRQAQAPRDQRARKSYVSRGDTFDRFRDYRGDRRLHRFGRQRDRCGGTFISFPVLNDSLGLTEKLANATSTVALWPGYAAGAIAAGKELAAVPREALTRLTIVSVVGGAAGGALLLCTSNGLFRHVMPILLAVGTMLFAAGPLFNRQLDGSDSQAALAAESMPVLFTVAVYNGYFGAGGGVLVSAGLTAVGIHDARHANIFKMLVQVTSNAAPVAVLSWSSIAWRVALAMIPGAIIGGFVGMRIANRMPRQMLRATILAAGAILTVYYGVKTYGGHF
jgi:uncharacterized protein